MKIRPPMKPLLLNGVVDDMSKTRAWDRDEYSKVLKGERREPAAPCPLGIPLVLLQPQLPPLLRNP